MADALPITRQINEWEGRWPLNTYADIDASKLSGHLAGTPAQRRQDDTKPTTPR